MLMEPMRFTRCPRLMSGPSIREPKVSVEATSGSSAAEAAPGRRGTRRSLSVRRLRLRRGFVCSSLQMIVYAVGFEPERFQGTSAASTQNGRQRHCPMGPELRPVAAASDFSMTTSPWHLSSLGEILAR